MSSRNALPLWKSGSLNWNPNLKSEADALHKETEDFPVSLFRAALDGEAIRRMQAFRAGVSAYQSHPYIRDVETPAAIWQQGNSTLLDYAGPKDGPVVLAVPSLINKSYILDLNKQRSFMRSMAQKGLRSFLLDWGDLGDQEKNMSLDDYITIRLQDCIDEIIHLTGRKIALVGYCMGGVLATAATALNPDKISALALLATPWDFHAGNGQHKRLIMAMRPQLEWTLQTLGHLPVDVIQALFALIAPYDIIRKFSEFTKLDPKSAAAKKFVAMEDWLNDGVPLSNPVARECLFDWYIKNTPMSGKWELDGHYINPAEIQCPSLLVVPENDRIVPPESALALKNSLPNARTMMLPAGHIGMVSGRKAVGSLYTPLSKWLLSHAI